MALRGYRDGEHQGPRFARGSPASGGSNREQPDFQHSQMVALAQAERSSNCFPRKAGGGIEAERPNR